MFDDFINGDLEDNLKNNQNLIRVPDLINLQDTKVKLCNSNSTTNLNVKTSPATNDKIKSKSSNKDNKNIKDLSTTPKINNSNLETSSIIKNIKGVIEVNNIDENKDNTKEVINTDLNLNLINNVNNQISNKNLKEKRKPINSKANKSDHKLEENNLKTNTIEDKKDTKLKEMTKTSSVVDKETKIKEKKVTKGENKEIIKEKDDLTNKNNKTKTNNLIDQSISKILPESKSLIPTKEVKDNIRIKYNKKDAILPKDMQQVKTVSKNTKPTNNAMNDSPVKDNVSNDLENEFSKIKINLKDDLLNVKGNIKNKKGNKLPDKDQVTITKDNIKENHEDNDNLKRKRNLSHKNTPNKKEDSLDYESKNQGESIQK
mmetsp:Transcript_25992/g.21894  ORF Transcript_25992/g.21894 Transcript_25992/m.21894 type:complete len:373 (+) Transcript_25992:1171-2289(+)